MSDQNYNQTILIGAAVAAGILGTLTGLLGFRKTNKGLTEQAKDFACQALEVGDMVNKKMILGGVAGGIVGAVAALFLAPKSGSELIKDITRPFTHGHSHSTSHKKGRSHPAKSRSARQTISKRSEKKEHHASTTKKAPARRRTAKAAPKVIASHEKAINEAKEA